MSDYNGMKMLFFDIECTFSRGAIWQLHREIHSYKNIEKPWYILSWAAKWAHQKRIYSSGLPKFEKEWKKDPENDKFILQELRDMLHEADVAVAHNGKRFDVKKINTRFLIHDIPPPSPYKIIDTLTMARSNFSFPSNKMDDIAEYLGIKERKKQHSGLDMWWNCLAGQKKAWKNMVSYNRQDVRVLEEIYYKMREYTKTHPNAGNYIEDESETPVCHLCGGNNLVKDGFAYTNLGKYQRYRCKACGRWGRGRKNFNSPNKKSNLTMRIV